LCVCVWVRVCGRWVRGKHFPPLPPPSEKKSAHALRISGRDCCGARDAALCAIAPGPRQAETRGFSALNGSRTGGTRPPDVGRSGPRTKDALCMRPLQGSDVRRPFAPHPHTHRDRGAGPHGPPTCRPARPGRWPPGGGAPYSGEAQGVGRRGFFFSIIFFLRFFQCFALAFYRALHSRHARVDTLASIRGGPTRRPNTPSGQTPRHAPLGRPAAAHAHAHARVHRPAAPPGCCPGCELVTLSRRRPCYHRGCSNAGGHASQRCRRCGRRAAPSPLPAPGPVLPRARDRVILRRHGRRSPARRRHHPGPGSRDAGERKAEKKRKEKNERTCPATQGAPVTNIHPLMKKKKK